MGRARDPARRADRVHGEGQQQCSSRTPRAFRGHQLEHEAQRAIVVPYRRVRAIHLTCTIFLPSERSLRIKRISLMA